MKVLCLTSVFALAASSALAGASLDLNGSWAFRFEEGKSIEDLSLDRLKEFSPAFEEDIYEAVSLRTCVEKRLTLGAPGSEMMKKVIGEEKAWLEDWHKHIGNN